MHNIVRDGVLRFQFTAFKIKTSLSENHCCPILMSSCFLVNDFIFREDTPLAMPMPTSSVLDEHDAPQWYDIVHFEHKLS